MPHSPTIASISIATPRLRSSRSSLDSLIIDDERVTPEPDDSTKMIQPNQGRWLSPFFQAASDLRSSNLNWKLWIITVLLVVGFMLTLNLLLNIQYWPYRVSVGCGISGFFSPLGTQPSLFAISQFFQINIGLGSLTFTEAKVIDIIWDSVVGRVGQVCLALVSWRVFADCATVSLTTRPLSFTAFHTIFLDSEPSIFSAWNVAKSFISQKRLASKVASAFIIFVMFFILAWPTLASAATGYVPITQAVVQEQLEGSKTDPNLIAFSRFQPVAYIIHDFWRVDTLNTSLIVYDTSATHNCLYFPQYDSSCSLVWSVSNYTLEYGFYGLSNKSSRFMDVQLEPPALNIEACSVLPQSGRYYGEPVLHGWDWIDPRNQSDSFRPFHDVSRNAWAYSNKTYYLADIIAGGSCTPETDRYRWGASFLQLFVMHILLSIWGFGIFLLWLFYHARLQLIDKPGVPRGYQALEILMSNVNDQFQKGGFELSEMSDHDTKYLIKKRLKGGCISFRGSIEVQSFKSWIRKEWGYMSFLISLFIFSFVLYQLIWYKSFLYFTMFTFLFPSFIASCSAWDVGKTKGSRLIVFFLGVVLGSTVGLVIVFTRKPLFKSLSAY